MASKQGKGRRQFQDAVDSLHTDTSLTDLERRGLQNCIQDAIMVLGGPDRFLDQNIVATYNIFRGANASLSLSITT